MQKSKRPTTCDTRPEGHGCEEPLPPRSTFRHYWLPLKGRYNLLPANWSTTPDLCLPVYTIHHDIPSTYRQTYCACRLCSWKRQRKGKTSFGKISGLCGLTLSIFSFSIPVSSFGSTSLLKTKSLLITGFGV